MRRQDPARPERLSDAMGRLLGPATSLGSQGRPRKPLGEPPWRLTEPQLTRRTSRPRRPLQ